MPPFHEPVPIVNGIKERIESIYVHGDRLFAGTSTGSLQIYKLAEDADNVVQSELVTSKNLGRRAIEQIDYSKDINSLIVLSDSLVTIYPLPDLVPPAPLQQTRSAFSFALHSSVERVSPDGKAQAFEDVASAKSLGVPTVVTNLVVGCQRKLLIFSWRDGEVQDVKEATLPHSPRTITFVTPSVLCFAYSATDHVLFFMETMSTSELTMPTSPLNAATSIRSIGRGAFTGLGGYMTLGLTAKTKPLIENIGNDQVLIMKDNGALLVGADGIARHSSIDWPAPPEDLAFAKPYILSILPPGSLPNPNDKEASSTIAAPVIHVVSSITHLPAQVLVLPTQINPVFANTILRLLTPSPSSSAPLYFISTPSDRYTSAAEGSTIWKLRMRSWGDQVDELVDSEAYEDALALLNSIDKALLADKDSRTAKIRALDAVSNFEKGDYDRAINTFIDLDINPAKVVAMFPENISGRLHVPQEQWLTMFGGNRKDKRPRTPSQSIDETSSSPRLANLAAHVMRRPASPDPTRTKLRSAAEAIRQAAARDEDAASIRSKTRERVQSDSTKAVETLLRYLSDRRPQVTGALSAVHISPSQSHRFPNLSETSIEDLLSLPSAPLSSLTPEQLIRFAQIVDTALFKSYLVIRPGLLGPLCRLDNWCEVSEVEEVLQEREKYSELIFLYYGKRMHRKALDLLKRLSEKQSDVESKCLPTVEYLQKLGTDYMDIIFEYSRWLFQLDADLAFEVFTNELNELSRSHVTDFLEELDQNYCARYLEYLITERDESTTLFHDRLAELYLDMVLTAKRHEKGNFDETYSKLLDFIKRSDLYRTDRLFGLLPSDDLFEARAILLGRLGKHDNALETYVYRLRDFERAEEYCKSVYKPGSQTEGVYLTLLKIYLQPQQQAQSVDYLHPALALVARHSPRLDAAETLQLLPPLVTAQEVRSFLCEAVREPVFDTRVIREIRKSRREQVDGKLMALQSQRVKVTDIRICPQCHKRLGNSVVAVHSPRGEVTHYQCRDAFSRSREHTHEVKV